MGIRMSAQCWFSAEVPTHTLGSGQRSPSGVQVGREPRDLEPGDAERAVWALSVKLIERDGDVDFRGPAVHGRRGDRIV